MKSKDLSGARVLVLSAEGWNNGVIGVVAGKICDTYKRPTIMVSRDEEKGIGVGSARSIPSFSIIEGLRRCNDLLEGFGGHDGAAGLALRLDKLDAFEERINAIATELIPEEELIPRIEADAELRPDEISDRLADALGAMEPFGEGNAEPLFITRGLTIIEKRRVGNGSHLKLWLRAGNLPSIECIAFGLGDRYANLELGTPIDLCYHVRHNTFNGTRSVQLIGKAVRVCSSRSAR